IVDTGKDTIMIDTQDHGTYAINSTIENPTFIEYANYGEKEVLGSTTSVNNASCYSNDVVNRSYDDKSGAVEYLAQLLSEANERTTNPRSPMSQEQLESYIEIAEKIPSSDAETIVTRITDQIKLDANCSGSSTSLCSVANYDNLKRTILLEAVKNGCDETNGCDQKQIKDAAEDMKNLLSWYEKKLKEQIVSYTDTVYRTFNEQGTYDIEDTERSNGHLAVRMCYQVDWCKKYSSQSCRIDPPSLCSCGSSSNANGTYINGITESDGNVIEDDREYNCERGGNECIDQKCDDCSCERYPVDPGCMESTSAKTASYESYNGTYNCPQDFNTGRQEEFLLSQGETSFQNDLYNYCYSEEITSSDQVQRGTPSVQFGSTESPQKCVYPSLRDYEVDTAVSDSYITGGILNDVGSGFAGKTEVKDYQTCFDCNGCIVVGNDKKPTGVTLDFGESAGGSYMGGGGGGNDNNENGDNEGSNYGQGSISFSCYENEQTLAVTTTDRECTSDNGCVCVYSSTGINACAEKGDICKADGTISTQYCSKDELIINITTEDQTCTSSNGCACLYTSGKTYQCVKEGDICHKNAAITTNGTENQLGEIGVQFTKGYNFFEALDIANKDEVPINTAKDLIRYTNHKIVVVATFTSNQWMNIVTYDEKECTSSDDRICGVDFDLVPGNIYFVVAKSPFKLSVNTQGLVSSTQDYKTVTKNVTGWTLVPSGLFIREESGTMDIINNPNYNITQIAMWDDLASKYEYTIKDILGETYGSDIDLTRQPGIFIKIASESE
ncbi:hypothetical protein J6Z48_00895, partial [bacterium]|nr:hypothetical protein [bacterium]